VPENAPQFRGIPESLDADPHRPVLVVTGQVDGRLPGLAPRDLDRRHGQGGTKPAFEVTLRCLHFPVEGLLLAFLGYRILRPRGARERQQEQAGQDQLRGVQTRLPD
jgi:hypothetical protein